jgi:hypothetical protein
MKTTPSIIKKIIAAAFCCTSILIASCEKDVDIKLSESEAKVVVEGTIENGLPPIVTLTKTIGFFGEIDLQTLTNSFLHDANITVTEGNKTVTLKEYNFDVNGIKYYLYSVDTSDAVARNFKGEIGKTYQLKIIYQNQTYESTTTIQSPKRLDSIWYKPVTNPDQLAVNPNAVKLMARYTDADTFGNRYRYFTNKNHIGFLAPLYSVQDDALINGTTADFEIDAGFNRMDSVNRDTYGLFSKGDTVIVKWTAIDQGVFEFWKTLEFSYAATGNPFASPVKITTNLTGGALGVWQGYGNVFDTIIIPQ